MARDGFCVDSCCARDVVFFSDRMALAVALRLVELAAEVDEAEGCFDQMAYGVRCADASECFCCDGACFVEVATFVYRGCARQAGVCDVVFCGVACVDAAQVL